MRALVMGTCLALAASTLHAQAAEARPGARPDTDPRIAARLDAETGRQVTVVIDRARTSRLPVEPLVDKALEGASKRAPGPAIVRAVRDLAERLGQARQILGPSVPEPEIVAAAYALRGGLQPAALRRLQERRSRMPLLTSLGVFHELRGLRVGADTAQAAVVALQEAGVSEEQLAEFQREVARDIAVGGQPAVAAAVASELIANDMRAMAPGNANLGNSTNSTLLPNATRPKRKP